MLKQASAEQLQFLMCLELLSACSVMYVLALATHPRRTALHWDNLYLEQQLVIRPVGKDW
jgi:hypothetical protein